MPVLRVAKQIELSRQIAALTEEIEELRSEKNMLLGLFDNLKEAIWLPNTK